MHKLMLMLLLSVESSSAMAEQHELIGGNGSHYYFDVPHSPNSADIVPRSNLKMDDKKAGTIKNDLNKSNLSVEALEEYKCKEEQLRNLKLTASADKDKLTYIIDSVSSNMVDDKSEIACGKK